MADTPKVNASPVLDVPLALGCKGVTVAMQAVSQYPVVEKVTQLMQHPAIEKAKAKKELLWALFGFALILHGAQFQKLLLCFHVVSFFFFEKVKTAVTAMVSDVTAARDKLKADAPENTADAKKAPKKNDAKKKVDTTAEDAAIAKKALKAVDVEKLSTAAMELFVVAMCCLLVLHGGVPARLAVGHALVLLVSGYITSIITFPGHEDMQAWTEIFVRFALYVVCVGMSFVAMPLAVALYASLFGATFSAEYMLKFAEAKGKVPEGSSKEGSKMHLMALGGLGAFGALWQVWTYLAGGGMAWYFQLAYLPAVIAEGVLGLF